MVEKYEVRETQDILSNMDKFDMAGSVPIFYGANDDRFLAQDFQGVYNLSQNKLAQIASKKYQIIQHCDVAHAVYDELESMNLNVSGRMDNLGNKLRMDLVFKTDSAPVKDDASGIQIGFRVLNSYDKTASFRLEMFGFRMICQNGMSLGSVMNGIKEITYHIGKEKNIQIIREVTHQFINNVISSSSVLQEYVNNSIKDSIAYQDVLTVMNRYLKISKHRNEIAELLGFSVIEIYDKVTKKHTFQYMPDRITEKNLSRWELYNAITSYASHNDLNYQVETNLQEAAQKVLKNSYEKLLVVSI
jgi:hypothetical protein